MEYVAAFLLIAVPALFVYLAFDAARKKYYLDYMQRKRRND